MKRSRSSSCRRATVLAALMVALVAETDLLRGQESTGKIEGRVRDQAGQPIASAQVFIVGTAFNALTNPQGYYFINNVPAGAVAVRAAFIGHSPVQVEDVRVLAGQTITVDIQLQQTALQIEEITGPGATETGTLDVPAEPGDYEFHCQVHPDQMNGTLVVE